MGLNLLGHFHSHHGQGLFAIGAAAGDGAVLGIFKEQLVLPFGEAPLEADALASKAGLLGQLVLDCTLPGYVHSLRQLEGLSREPGGRIAVREALLLLWLSTLGSGQNYWAADLAGIASFGPALAGPAGAVGLEHLLVDADLLVDVGVPTA